MSCFAPRAFPGLHPRVSLIRHRLGWGLVLAILVTSCDKDPDNEDPGESGESSTSSQVDTDATESLPDGESPSLPEDATSSGDADGSAPDTTPDDNTSPDNNTSQDDTSSAPDNSGSKEDETSSDSDSSTDSDTPEDPDPGPVVNNYLIGTGIYDITGEVAETSLFGYAKGDLRTKGLRDRQYARAFIMQEPGKEPAVFVSIDKGGMFQATNLALMDKLSRKFNGVYKDHNVIVSATHTHVASGGMSHYELYKIASGGYFSKNNEITVQGILGAIERAHKNLAPGRIYFSRGTLKNASVNRSKPAYRNNKDSHKHSDIDELVTVLRFVNKDNREVGMLSWFAVHPTNLPKDWTLLSSDNKGYASMKFESLKQSRYDDKAFVAAFAQSNAGDMSPNLNQPKPSELTKDATGPGKTHEESMTIIGERQYQAVKTLYDRRGVQLKGSIQSLTRYEDFSKMRVEKAFTDQKKAYTTCTAALGQAFAAGAEDGRSDVSTIFKEGTVRTPGLLDNELDRCHAEKKILLVQGLSETTPWTPKILPVSIMKIGQLGILAAPSEFTVMSGRRARATVEAVKGTGITQTVFAGYSDAYAGYVTTREEYAKQNYEGGSTHFGPWTLGAFRQTFHRLAQTLADPAANPWPNQEPKIPRKTPPKNDGVTVIADSTPFGKDFGDVKTNAKPKYKVGSTVRVEFWGAHPNNNLLINKSYLQVQIKIDETWTDIALDRDQSTKYRWERNGIANSVVTIEWKIPTSALPGTYRIKHRGHAKTGSIEAYTGTSRVFEVEM